MKITCIVLLFIIFIQLQLVAQNYKQQIKKGAKNYERLEKVKVLLSEYKIEKAITEAEKIDQQNLKNSAYSKISLSYLWIKQLDEAILWADKIGQYGTNSQAYFSIADTLVRRGDITTALEYYKKALFDPEDETKKPNQMFINDYRNKILYLFGSNKYDLTDNYLETIYQDFSYIEKSLINYNIKDKPETQQQIVEYNLRKKTISKYYFEIIERLGKEKNFNLTSITNYIETNYPDSIPKIDDCLLICLGNENTKLNIEGSKYFIRKGATKNVVTAMLIFNEELNNIIYTTPGLINEGHKIELLKKFYGDNNLPQKNRYAQKTIIKLLSEISPDKIDLSWFYGAIGKGQLEVSKFFLNSFTKEILQKEQNIYSVVLNSKNTDTDRRELLKELNKLDFDYNITATEFISLYYYVSGYGEENIEKLKYYSKSEQNLIFYYMVIYGQDSYVDWLLKNGNIDFNYRPDNSTLAPDIVEYSLLIRPKIGESLLKYVDPKYRDFQADINSSDIKTMELMITKRNNIYSWVLKHCSFVDYKNTSKAEFLFLSKMLPYSHLCFAQGMFDKTNKDDAIIKGYVKYLKEVDFLFSRYVPHRTVNPYDFQDVMENYNYYLYLFYSDYIAKNKLTQYVSDETKVRVRYLFNPHLFSLDYSLVMEEYIRVLKEHKADFNVNAPILFSEYQKL